MHSAMPPVRTKSSTAAGPTIKVIVSPTPRCHKLLRFICDNLDDIRATQVHLRVIKAPADPSGIKALGRMGIGSVPAIIGTEGTIYIGEKRIYGMLNANLKRLRDARTNNVPAYPGAIPRASAYPYSATGDEITDYMLRGLYSQDDDGRMVPRGDADEDENAGASLTEGTRALEKRREMLLRRADSRNGGGRGGRAPGRTADPPPRDLDDIGARMRMGGGGTNTRDYDNIGDLEDDWRHDRARGSAEPPKLPPRKSGPALTSGMDQNTMDDMMMRAWQDNNGPE